MTQWSSARLLDPVHVLMTSVAYLLLKAWCPGGQVRTISNLSIKRKITLVAWQLLPEGLAGNSLQCTFKNSLSDSHGCYNLSSIV